MLPDVARRTENGLKSDSKQPLRAVKVLKASDTARELRKFRNRRAAVIKPN